MDMEDFVRSIEAGTHPPRLPSLLRALWYDRRGDWARAHKIVQGESGKDAAAVHAYLHRKEGDLANADYWYGCAQRVRCSESLADESRALTEYLLARHNPRYPKFHE